MMKCPDCKGYELAPKALEDGLIAASCGKCDGALLSLFNYRYWAKEHATDTECVQVDYIDELEETEEKAKMCPKCARLMTKFRINLDTGKKLDLCVHCDEAWLDKGEWKLLRKLELDGKLPEIFTDAWQKGLRAQRMVNLIKDRYRDMLGTEDFNKIDEFKTWLENHDKKEDIKQYLITQFD